MSAVPARPPSRDAGTASGRFRAGQDVAPHVRFAPRNGLHRIAGFLMLLALIGCAVAAYFMYTDNDPLHQSVLAGCAVLGLAMWGVRAATNPPRLSVRNGVLVIARTGSTESFDLTSRYTRIEVRQRPWRVRIEKAGLEPVRVSKDMVDPQAFMDVLRHYRPDL